MNQASKCSLVGPVWMHLLAGFVRRVGVSSGPMMLGARGRRQRPSAQWLLSSESMAAMKESTSSSVVSNEHTQRTRPAAGSQS